MLSYWEKNFFTNLDYVIIGSGILGLSTACSIKEKNPDAEILIVERGIIPSGASTKNAGFFTFGSLTEILADISRLGEDAAAGLVEKRMKGIHLLRSRLGDDKIGYDNYGGYELINEKYLPSLENIGYVNDILRNIFKGDAFIVKNELIKEFGFNNNFVKALVCSPYESQIDTGKMMNGLLKYARSLGINTLNGCEIKTVENKGDYVELLAHHKILDGNLVIRTKNVIAAVNAFVKNLFPNMDIVPGRGHVLITKPVPNLNLKGVFHFDEGYYYFRNYKNRVLLGGGRNLDFKSEETTSFEFNQMILNALKDFLTSVIMPGQHFEIEQCWTGIMAFTKDKLPVIKRYNERIIAAISCNGMGIALSSYIAEELVNELSL
ncbi:MAG: NAD(P)/FAD-dependent oxidoreductase [Ignavibacteria bacterium]